MKKNSVVWRFFDRIEEHGRCTAVICQLCEATYRFFGNTTNLRVHLSRKHPIQWELAHNKIENISTSFDGGINDTTSHSPRGRHKKYKDKNVRYSISVNLNEDNDGGNVEKSGAMSFIEIKPIDSDANESDNEHVETESATSNLLKDFEKRRSDEEWLEDPFDNMTETIKHKQKKIHLKKHIKQEYEESSPRRLSNYYLKSSPVKYEKALPGGTIVIEDPQHKDEYKVFGEYVANKLRKIKTPRTRGNIQQIITTVLWQAEYGAYDDADSVKNLFIPTNITAETNDTQEPVVVQIQAEDSKEDNCFE